MKKHLVSVFIAGAVLLLHAPANAMVVVDRVIAVVNEEIITLSDLQREETLKKAGGGQNERLLLEDMIDRKLQMAAAKRAGMDVTDKELTEAVADIMKRNSLDDKQFEAALLKEGISLEQYKAELREQMTLSRVFNKYVRSGLAVEETDLRAYYERNSGKYSLPEEIRVRRIFLKLPDNASASQAAAVLDRARTAYKRAKKGEDFVVLVREFSDGENASGDGDLGFIERDHALPEIEQAARALKPGEVAEPLQFSGGYNIIRLEEVRNQVKPFEKVKDEISNALFQQKLENSYRSWLQTLRGDSHIENRL